MITKDVFDRVFFVRGDSYGTAFTGDVAGRQYLISASHLFPADPIEIQIYLDDRWQTVGVRVVGRSKGSSDIVVLALDRLLSHTQQIQLTSADMFVSQEVYLLGFPHKGGLAGGPIFPGRPLPFVKRGLLSGWELDADNRIVAAYIDTYSNVGLSGGPVVFVAQNGERRIGGVISMYRLEEESVLDKYGEPTGMTVKQNSGIAIAANIRLAMEWIVRNPVGPSLSV